MTHANKKNRFNLQDLQNKKSAGEPISCLTCYTTPMAKILDPHCDVLLVGDSLGMVVYGMDNTLDVTLDMMINHGKAVMRGVDNAFVIVDLPHGTYEESPKQALSSAKTIIEETACDAVKLEGAADFQDTIKLLVQNNIPVMAHIGLKPQHVVKEGGYKIKGKTPDQIGALMHDAKIAEQAGAFAILIEGTIDTAAAQLTQSVSVPTIGIGAGIKCDGQILVTPDMLGMITEHTPKFAKKYLNLAELIGEAAQSYTHEVRTGAFPSDQYTYKKKS